LISSLEIEEIDVLRASTNKSTPIRRLSEPAMYLVKWTEIETLKKGVTSYQWKYIPIQPK
jgi:hypothetical protein